MLYSLVNREIVRRGHSDLVYPEGKYSYGCGKYLY